MGASDWKRNNGGGKQQGWKAGGGGKSSSDWMCKKCVGADGTPFRNFGCRMQCMRCNGHKQWCHLANVPVDPPRKVTLAQKQVRDQQRADKETRAKNAKLEAELAKVKKDLAAVTGKGQAAEAAMDVDDEEPKDKRKAIQLAKKQIAWFEEQPQAHLQEMANPMRAQLAELQREQVAARPFSQQIRDLESKAERKRKAIKKKEDEAEEHMQAATDAWAAYKKGLESVRELQEQLAEIQQEKGQLVDKEREEQPKPAPVPAPAGTITMGQCFSMLRNYTELHRTRIVATNVAAGGTEEQVSEQWGQLEAFARLLVAAEAAPPGQAAAATAAATPPVGPEAVPMAHGAVHNPVDASGSGNTQSDLAGEGARSEQPDDGMRADDPAAGAKRLGEEIEQAQRAKSAKTPARDEA